MSTYAFIKNLIVLSHFAAQWHSWQTLTLHYQSSLKSFWMMGYRHLDNLLLTKDGRLFHIDFGFILGRDPKPFPPPMKLCKEMVEAMGGAERYTLFPKMLNPNFLV
jgi:hypothetical protein